MGTTTFENGGVNEHLPYDRPKVYPCTDCGNGLEFTKLALEVHRKKCSHRESCVCIACRFNSLRRLELRRRIFRDIYVQKCINRKRSRLSENHATIGTGNSMNVTVGSGNSMNLTVGNGSSTNVTLATANSLTETFATGSTTNATVGTLNSTNITLATANSLIATVRIGNSTFATVRTGNSTTDSESNVVKQSPSNESISLGGCEIKGPEGRSESSDSWETSHSDDSQRNQSKRLLYLKAVPPVDPKSKLPRGRPTENSDNLENNHDGEPCNRKIFCVICDKHIFWESFGTHVLQHSIKIENSHLVCPQCNQAYRSPNLYLMHFPCHLVNHDCLDCHCDHPKCFKRSAVPSPEHSYAGASTCYICLKTLNGNPSIVTHLKIHCKECPFTCEECNRSFRQTGNLQRHLLAHRGEKPHKCPSCGTGFSDPATLRNHVRTHTKETPFVCKVCKRGFSQVGNLKRHMALHVEKEKDASVLILNGGLNEKSIGVVEEEIGPDDEKSSGSDLFSDSEARKTSDAVNDESQGRTKKRGRNGLFTLHVCKLCGKKYAWLHDLTIHFRTHTGEKPYKCELCDKKFAQSGAVRMHNARHHNKSKLNAKKLTPRLKVVSSIST